MSSRRQQIVEALKARLEAITIANGFDTNVGTTIYVGESPDLGPDDADTAIAIVVGDEEPQFQGEHVYLELPISIQAIAKANLDESWLNVEAVIGDIKRAVELADRTLGGLVKRQIVRGPVRALHREPGNTTVGASVTYIAPFTEVWGSP